MTEEDFAESEDDLPTGLPSDQEWLEDLEEHLKDFLDQVERAKQRADEDPINRHQFGRVKRVLESHDEQLDRQEFIHSVGNAARTEIPPFDKEDRVGNSDRRRKMMHLQNTVFQMWDNATAAYIDGQFYAAAVTMTSAFEGYLKHEIEKRDLDDNPRNLSLKDAISTARGEIIPHAGAEASDAADRILKIRNNLVHHNVERGVAEEYDSGLKPPDKSELDMNKLATEHNKKIARETIEDCSTVAEYIYESEGGLE